VPAQDDTSRPRKSPHRTSARRRGVVRAGGAGVNIAVDPRGRSKGRRAGE
jgi:hypothetical protein